MSVLSGTWRKSSRSGDVGCCVEVRRHRGGVEIRDSKNPMGPALHFGANEWGHFVRGVALREFDRT